MYEYERLEVTDDKNSIHLENLKSVLNSSNYHPLKDYLTSSNGQIYANQYCGLFSDGEKTYRILPKISDKEEDNQKYLLYMLLKAYNIKLKNEDFIQNVDGQELTLLDILIKIYTDKVWREISKGVYREYISEQDNLNVLKGRWMIQEHIRRNYFNEKIYCDFDEFSENNLLNQLFMYSAKILRSDKNDIRKSLKRLELAFDETDSIRINPYLFNFTFNRLNIRFESSAMMAIMLLKHFVADFRDIQKKGFTFLFNMNDLFEKFIANILKEMETELDYKVEIQNSKIAIGSEKKVKPDITLINKTNNKEEAKLIIDTKYKLLNKNPSDADLYQMYAYGMSYDFPVHQRKVMLLYPAKVNTEFEEKDITMNGTAEHSEVQISARTISLHAENLKYNEYVDKIKENLKEIINKQIN